MSKEGQVLYSSLKLAYGAFQKGQATMRLDKPKPTTKDFADYVNANYKVVGGSLELKKVINKKETKK